LFWFVRKERSDLSIDARADSFGVFFVFWHCPFDLCEVGVSVVSYAEYSFVSLRTLVFGYEGFDVFEVL
jgi:hypothetical protein